jgi:hypothetical protein
MAASSATSTVIAAPAMVAAPTVTTTAAGPRSATEMRATIVPAEMAATTHARAAGAASGRAVIAGTRGGVAAHSGVIRPVMHDRRIHSHWLSRTERL